jgi:hypothetical protein
MPSDFALLMMFLILSMLVALLGILFLKVGYGAVVWFVAKISELFRRN